MREVKFLNAAIVYANKVSQKVQYVVEQYVNPTLEIVGKTKICIAAYIRDGRGGGLIR